MFNPLFYLITFSHFLPVLLYYCFTCCFDLFTLLLHFTLLLNVLPCFTFLNFNMFYTAYLLQMFYISPSFLFFTLLLCCFTLVHMFTPVKPFYIVHVYIHYLCFFHLFYLIIYLCYLLLLIFTVDYLLFYPFYV